MEQNFNLTFNFFSIRLDIFNFRLFLCGKFGGPVREKYFLIQKSVALIAQNYLLLT